MDLFQAEYKRVHEAANWVKSSMPFVPEVAIILGTGMAGWLDKLEIVDQFSFMDVPHLVPPTTDSHQGRIVFAMVEDVPIVVMAGRLHFYEGHPMTTVVRPVRVLYTLGCRKLVMTNASGGLNPGFNAGDLVLLNDHINLVNEHPLRGPNDYRWGPRFPDMKHAYDPEWILFSNDQAEKINIHLKQGIYAGLPGPSLETPAEYQYLYRIGADMVGMSTVPEVITANHLGMKVLVLSIISNVCYPPERIKVTTVEDVIQMVESKAEDAGRVLVKALAYKNESAAGNDQSV